MLLTIDIYPNMSIGRDLVATIARHNHNIASQILIGIVSAVPVFALVHATMPASEESAMSRLVLQ